MSSRFACDPCGYDIKDVKHVAQDAVSFFMNEDNLGRSVECLGLLKRKETIVIIAFLVLGAERLNPLGFKIIGRKIFKIVPPVRDLTKLYEGGSPTTRKAD